MPHPKPLTAATEDQIRRLWGTMSQARISEATGIPRTRLYRTAQKLGLGPLNPQAAATRAARSKARQQEAMQRPDYRVGGKVPCGKKRVNQAPAPKQEVKPWNCPMNSPEYKAWMASKVAGKVPVYGIDKMNRPTVTYTNQPH